MVEVSCFSCELVFESELFDLSCKNCLQTFQGISDFHQHFLNVKVKKLVCQTSQLMDPSRVLETVLEDQKFDPIDILDNDIEPNFDLVKEENIDSELNLDDYSSGMIEIRML